MNNNASNYTSNAELNPLHMDLESKDYESKYDDTGDHEKMRNLKLPGTSKDSIEANANGKNKLLQFSANINCIVFCVLMSSDNKWIISGKDDNTIEVYKFNITSSNNIDLCKSVCTLKGHNNEITTISISNDNQWIVSGSSDNTIKIWKFDNGSSIFHDDKYQIDTCKCICTLDEHTKGITSISMSNDSMWITSASNDKTIKIWRFDSEHQQCSCVYTLDGHHKPVKSISVSTDRNWIISGSSDKTIKIWKLNHEQLIANNSGNEMYSCIYTLEGHNSTVFSVSISSDNQWIASGSGDNVIRIWKFHDGESILNTQDTGNQMNAHICTLAGHDSWVNQVSISRDNKWVISASNDKTVKVWKFDDGKSIFSESGNDTCVCVCTLQGHTYWVYSAFISNDNQWIVSGSGDSTFKVWKFDDGRSIVSETGDDSILTLVEHEEEITTVAISFDNNWIVSGSVDKKIKVWSFNDGKSIKEGHQNDMVECVHTLSGHDGEIKSVAISNDNKWIASGSLDKKIKIWKFDYKEFGVPDNHQKEICTCICTLDGHDSPIMSVLISSNNKWIVSASHDKTINEKA